MYLIIKAFFPSPRGAVIIIRINVFTCIFIL